MDSLISSFGGASLGGGVQKLHGDIKVYISEVSSPTRLWIQEADGELNRVIKEMNDFYNNIQPDDFKLLPNQFIVGLRIAAFGCGQWDRAEVVSEPGNNGLVKLFFIDYGTTGSVHIEKCKLLFEQYAMVPRKAIRGALYGVKPVGNARLWDLNITTSFIKEIQEKIHHIKIMKHHPYDDFYEFLLYDSAGRSVNDRLIQHGKAQRVQHSDPLPACLSYPSFKFLEKLKMYPSYSERLWMLDRRVDFNKFEENYLPSVGNTYAFEQHLSGLLNDSRFLDVKKIIMRLLDI